MPARRAARAHLAHLRRRGARRRRSALALDVADGVRDMAFFTDELRCPIAVADLAAARARAARTLGRRRPAARRRRRRAHAPGVRAPRLCAATGAIRTTLRGERRRPRPAQAHRPRLLAGARPAERAPARRARGPGGVRAVVVGAGVVGLTTAVRLREAGIDADVVARDEPPETTSAVAAALWYPYRALPAERVTAWSAADLLRAGRAGRGGGQRRAHARGHRAAGAPTRPTRGGARRCRACERTREGLRFVAPAVDMSVHLPWLVSRLRALGGTVERRDVASLDELEADAVVNCAGLGARELAGDAVADRGARPGRPRGGARRARVAARPVRPASGSSTSCPREQRRRAGRDRGRGRRGPHARPGDDGRHPRALRRARPRPARRAGGRRRRRAAARAPGGAPGGRGPRRALLRPRRRRRDPGLGLRWGGSRTSGRPRPALRCPR